MIVWRKVDHVGQARVFLIRRSTITRRPCRTRNSDVAEPSRPGSPWPHSLHLMRSGIAVHGISGVGDKALSTTYNPSLGVVAPVDGLPDGLPTSILEQEHHPGRSNSHAVCSRPAESQVIQSVVVTYSSMKLPGLVMQDSQGWTRLRHRRYLLTQALRLQKCTYCRRHCGPSKFSRLEDERTLSRCKRLRWLGWCSTYYKADCLSARYARDERLI